MIHISLTVNDYVSVSDFTNISDVDSFVSVTDVTDFYDVDRNAQVAAFYAESDFDAVFNIYLF